MKNVIKVENLSKRFMIGHEKKENYTALRDVVARSAKKIFSFSFARSGAKTTYTTEEFWALKNINFEINQGDRVGIIGRNGAGKSTLLKVLSRITEPSSGSVRLNGRVASLLEVGTGFHPELTGRENIFLNGAILGMSRGEIRRKFDEIVAFAEVEKFLDTPVKRYSSGMYVRLAFAVAAHLEPEILIVDEVLAVGDAQFQKKCLGKMQDVSKNEGRTILFVSHNMTAIQSLCNRGILLRKGELVANDTMEKVSEKYLEEHNEIKTKISFSDPDSAIGSEFVKIKRAEIVPLEGDVNSITVDKAFNIEFEFWNLKNYSLNLSLVLWNKRGECVFNVASALIQGEPGLYKSICHVPANFLNDDKYTVHVYFIKDASDSAFNQPDILTFEIYDLPRTGSWFGKWVGVVRPIFDFSLNKI